VPGKCLEVPDRDIIDRMRKTAKQSVMLACVMYDLLRTFVWKKKYFFFLIQREALFCFQQTTWQRLLTFAVT